MPRRNGRREPPPPSPWELIRRAVVAAALDDAPVSDSHLAAAVEDLMADAETLTRSLLGSGTDAAGSL